MLLAYQSSIGLATDFVGVDAFADSLGYTLIRETGS